MADQSGKVGEIYIEAKVIPRVDEAALRSVRDTIQAGEQRMRAGAAGVGIGAGARAAMKAEALLDAREIGWAVGSYRAAESAERVAVQGAIAESRVRYGRMNRVESAWDAVALAQQKQFEAAGIRVDRSWNAAALAQQRADVMNARRADAALESYRDPIDLSSAVRDADKKGRIAMSAEAEAAAKRNQPIAARMAAMGQAEVMSTGLFMTALFSGWELSTAATAAGRVRQMSMNPRAGELGQLEGEIHRMMSGPTAWPINVAMELGDSWGDRFGRASRLRPVRDAIESARVSVLRSEIAAAGYVGSVNEPSRVADARRRVAVLDEDDSIRRRYLETEIGAGDVRSIYGRAMVELDQRIAHAWTNNDTIGAGRAMADAAGMVHAFKADLEIARLEENSAKSEIRREIARTRRNIVSGNPALDLAAAGRFGAADRAQMLIDIEDSIANSPSVYESQLRARGNAMIAADQARGRFQGQAFAASGYAASLAASGMGAASQAVMIEAARQSALQTARPEAERGINYAAELQQQNLVKMVAARTSLMSAANESARYLLAGKPTEAQATQIVAQTVASLPGLDNAQQQRLALQNASLQLQTLAKSQINPISSGTPSLFVGGGAPMFDAAPFQKQLDAGAAGFGALQGITAGVAGGNTETNAILTRIYDVLAKAFN